MSVIIKGMKMPKRHLFEAFVAIGDGQIVVKDLEKNKLFAGKIEEIPTPHGRVIDADRLKSMMEKYHCNGCDNYNGARCSACWVDDCFSYIDDIPAIIEAEVRE